MSLIECSLTNMKRLLPQELNGLTLFGIVLKKNLSYHRVIMLDKLLETWEYRLSSMRAYAEEGFFANDTAKEQHFAICVRQWETAINELKEQIALEGITKELYENI